MKKITLALAVLALGAMLWAADNVAVAPRQAAGLKPEATRYGAEAITIPQMLSYQGKLTDTLGQPVPDNDYSVTFKLYTVPSGGAAFWNETQSVKTRAGLFSVLLGSVTPVGAIPAGGALYLGMAVSGGAELSPRLRIASTAYAYKADTANYALASPGSGGDNAWVRNGLDSVLYTTHMLGLARGGAQNALLGNFPYTQLNLGVACTTGVAAGPQMYATVLGYKNVVSGNGSAAVVGGQYNRATGYAAGIGAGYYNLVSGRASGVCAGTADTVQADFGAVLGGMTNVAGDGAGDTGAVVTGGIRNRATGKHTLVGSGTGNTASGTDAAVVGGVGNTASGNYSFVGGGTGNSAALTSAVVAGGQGNHASANWSTVGGGGSNIASGSWATVAGGYTDSATGNYSFAAGEYNTASGRAAIAAGGTYNTVSGEGAAVLGGTRNTAADSFCAVVAGSDNTVNGRSCVILGGTGNICCGTHNLMFGYGVVDTTSGGSKVILFNDIHSGTLDLNRPSNDNNGYFPIIVGTNTSNGNGAVLQPWGAWFDVTKRNQCEGEALDRSRVLDGVLGLDLERWKLKKGAARYISPDAGEFNRTFGCSSGNKETDTTSISPLDVASISLAGVQELRRRLDIQQAEIEALKAELQRR